MRTLLVLWLLFGSAFALAHRSSDSYLDISIDAGGASIVRWDIDLRDLDMLLPLDADNDRLLTWGEVRAAEPAIRSLARATLELVRDGRPCALDFDDPALRIEEHASGNFAVLTLAGDCGAGDGLLLDYRFLAGIDADHRGIARLREGDHTRTLVLVPGEPLQIDARSALRDWLGHVREGMHHIATGYDHLLFLLSLLLPVALVRAPGSGAGWRPPLRDAVVLVTAFTAAHSLTLALAALQLVVLPGRLVETAIAASVVAAALLNLVRHTLRTRWIIAFAFGLVHGFGFAAMLQGLPSSGTERALVLLAFNLGVEVGQLAAVAVFLPVALWVARRDAHAYARFALRGGSLGIALAGMVWFCQRAFDLNLSGG